MRNILWLLALMPFLGTASAQKTSFPESHLGTWKGSLHIEPSKADIPMSLRLGPAVSGDSVFEYVLTYADKDIREYFLVVEDRSAGFFGVDEKNSIRLQERLLGNKLISVFGVEGSMLLISLEMHADEILFEVFSWPDKAQVSGGKADVPLVHSFTANAYQRAVLKKVDK